MILQWTLDGGIGRLTLNQPPSNTMTLEFFNAFRTLMETLPRTQGLKAVIVSGRGRHFSSGANVDELLAAAEPGLMKENYESFLALEEMDIPVVAAIRGICLGSAFELALFCHYRVCASDAVLGLPEATFNLMPGIGGISRAAALAGEARTVERILRGNTFPAGEAHDEGLVDLLVPRQEVDAAAVSLALAVSAKFRNSDRKLFIQNYRRKIHAAD